MPVTTGWDNPEKTIFRSTIAGAWSVEDFREHSTRFKQHLAEVSHPVISLIDVRTAKLSTSNMIEAARVTFTDPVSNVDRTFIITTGKRWQTAFRSVERLMTRFFPSFELPLVWVTSEEEAYRMIEQHWRHHKRHGYR